MTTTALLEGTPGPGPDASIGDPASLLDIGYQKSTTHGWRSESYEEWVRNAPARLAERRSRRRARSYHRAMSGLRLSGQYRMLTLTTSVEAEAAGREIERSWASLVMRLTRRGWCDAYFRVKEYTEQGRPHLHVIIRGRYVPQRVLSVWWGQLHLSPVVDIREVGVKRGAAGYLAKYLGKDSRARYSWSWRWVWKGFCKDWRELCVWGWRGGWPREKVLEAWHDRLDTWDMLALDFG